MTTATKEQDNRPLILAYRPQTFEEVVGHESVVKSLKAQLASAKRPHTFLLVGGSGQGKTTLGRIIAREVGCDKSGLIEIDGATTGSAEEIRALTEGASYRSITGKAKVIIVDECFSKGTLVETKTGMIPIESIKPGMQVLGIRGFNPVKRVIKKWVSASHMVKLRTSTDKEILCSEDHGFLTTQGWITARNLDGKSVFTKNSPGIPVELQEVWDRVYEFRSGCSILQRVLEKSLSCLSENILVPFKDMLTGVWEPSSSFKENWSTVGDYYTGGYKWSSQESSRKNSDVGSYKRTIFSENESFKSIFSSRRSDKNATNQGKKQHSIHGTQRGKWNGINQTTSLATLLNWWRTGVHNTNREESRARWLASKICGRYRISRDEISDRDRWEHSSSQEDNREGSSERTTFETVRVESPTLYELRNKLESSWDSRDSEEGAWFYDLEVENHPSYSVEGMIVHNCHVLSKTAWQALLKAIEEPASHVYWILLTTEDGKVPATIKTRATTYQLKPVPTNLLEQYAKVICDLEGINLPEGALKLIAEESTGSPRQLLNYLSVARSATTLKEIRDVLSTVGADEEDPLIQMCLAIMRGEKNPNTFKGFIERMETFGGSKAIMKSFFGGNWTLSRLGDPKVAKIMEAVDRLPDFPSEKGGKFDLALFVQRYLLQCQ